MSTRQRFDPSSCPRVRQRLSEYIDGELEPATRAEVSVHLANCTECARLEEDLEAVIEALHRLGCPPAACRCVLAAGTGLDEA
jgi:anti-sigma factor RsiW